MKTVHEVSKLSGVSIRTLHYYDEIGLLPPSDVTQAGYRLYDDAALRRLQSILLFKALGFPLKDIRRIVTAPDFDCNAALERQIALLTMQREHIDNLITFARGLQVRGVKNLSFTAFDAKKLDDYARQAKMTWGNTAAYKEFAQKSKDRTPQQENALAEDMMDIFRRMGEIRQKSPQSEEAQALAEELRGFITAHYYECTIPIFSGLGMMYGGGGAMTENIDKAGGKGTGEFAAQVVAAYCAQHT